MGSLAGKVAFVTGGARGQGRAHCVRLASDGADIITVDICHNIESNGYDLASPADLDETVRLVKDTGRRIEAAEADVRDYGQLKAVVAQAVRRLGRLDILVANAGIAPISVDEEEETGDTIFRDVIDVDLVGVWNACRAALPHLRAGGNGGSMVLTSSTAGIKGYTGASCGAVGYTAAKHGVIGIMRSLANALAKENIRVNTIHPTGVNTAMLMNPLMTKWIESQEDFAANLSNPLPVDLLEPEDIANTVSFLVSEEARYITGVTMPVDAGFCNR